MLIVQILAGVLPLSALGDTCSGIVVLNISELLVKLEFRPVIFDVFNVWVMFNNEDRFVTFVESLVTGDIKLFLLFENISDPKKL